MGLKIIVIALLVLCGGYLIYFWLIHPVKEQGKLDFLKYAPIAHRGLHGLKANTPENSLPAFAAAIEKGYNIETDIWRTKDGVPVCFHDGDLKRMCGVEGHVREKTWEELQQLSLAGTAHKIPSLQQLLDLVDGRVALLVEMKGDAKEGIEQAAYEVLCRSNTKYAVQAFHPKSMAWFKKHAPHVMRGQLAMPCFKQKGLPFFHRLGLHFLLLNFFSRPHFVSYGCDGMGNYPSRAMIKMHGGLFFWTVRDQETFDKGRRFGDNLIFEGFIPDLSKPIATKTKKGAAPKGALQ